MSEFNVGDRVRVTRDAGGSGHEFAPGTVGVIEKDSEGDWRISGEFHVVGPEHESWWVYGSDLEPVDETTTSSHARVLNAITVVAGLDLSDQVKTSVIKTLVDSL